MSNLYRVSIALVFFAGLAWCLSCTATTQPQADHDDATGPLGVESQSDDGQSLAARYHQRKRTKRFFDRAKGRRVAARYHLRGRTERFFDRAENDQVAARYHLRGRTERFFDRAESDQVAARYHLRGRTKRFFGRTVV